MIPENEMLHYIKRGDKKAFELLFNTIYMQLYVYCRKFIAEPEEAKDLLQNVFLRFWEKREELDIHTSLKSYLYRSVQNECLNYLRTIQYQNTVSEKVVHTEALEEDNLPDIILVNKDILDIFTTTLSQLPEGCRKVFCLSREKGMKNIEIADELGISVRTVETQIYRALKILKTNLQEYLI